MNRKRKKGNRTETSSFGTKGRISHNASKFYNSNLYRALNQNEGINGNENKLPKNLLNTHLLASSEDMSMVPNNSVHLVVTSPPYNVCKDYDNDLSLSEYLQMLKNAFEETYRVLIYGGRMCINVANVGRKPYIPLSDHISKMMIKIGFNMRGEIIWDKGASASHSTAWGSWASASNPTLRDIHEYILVFSKGDFKRQLSKEEMQSKKNSISKENFLSWTKSIWTFKAESAKKIGHPAPFPIDLPDRLIQLYSFETDIILDPFMGSGTTAIAALKNKRQYLGFEVNREYIYLAKEREKTYLESK
ncbi:methyltransferase [Elysia marginata]|uniref:site-specific DNA-methyltransferase (cytosine-N(4)-specific) n=1 Tax=Elysia marginata TaxID=1093978 RepID=A0AAV4FQ43_9GAST|nr:methyltransferase [Elysia marginata]